MFWKRKKNRDTEWKGFANFDEAAQFLFDKIVKCEKSPKRPFEQIKNDLELMTGNNIRKVSDGLTHCYLSNNFDGSERLQEWVDYHAKNSHLL